MSLLGVAFDSLLDLLAPRDCAACGAPAARGFCGECLTRLIRPEERWLAGVPLIGAASYRDPIDRAILRFKFGGRPDLARPLARLLRPKLFGLDHDWIVPVPLHPARLAERGYNQAALLARALGTGRPCAARALQRLRPTSQQALLDRVAREHNVAGAFAAHPRARSRGRRVLLVDDVVTTGATARACMDALGNAGAEVVAVACAALAEHAPIPVEKMHDC